MFYTTPSMRPVGRDNGRHNSVQGHFSTPRGGVATPRPGTLRWLERALHGHGREDGGVRWDEAVADTAFLEFWTQRRVCLLSTVRPDGRPHAVAVGATLDPDAGLVRVITSRGSRKVAHVAAAGPGGARVAVSQVDGARWCSVEGVALVRTEPDRVAEAVRRYAHRYRQPRPNPERVVIEVAARAVLGRW
jgi:PPOX class probable F420-dependent enzyme